MMRSRIGVGSLVVLGVAMSATGCALEEFMGSRSDMGEADTSSTKTSSASASASVSSSTGAKTLVKACGSVTTLATGLHDPTGIAAYGDAVYVTTYGGDVVSIPVIGGLPTTLTTGEGYPWGATADAINVYWTAVNSNAIRKMPVGGGLVTTLATASGSATRLVVDANNVYWGDRQGIYAVPIAGGTSTTLFTDKSMKSEVAVDSTSLYWLSPMVTGSTSQGALMKMPLTGGSPTTLASKLVDPMGIAVDTTSVYWTDVGNSGAANGTVNKVALDGSSSPVALATGEDAPAWTALSADRVYWVNSRDPSSVRMIPAAGGAESVVLSLDNAQNAKVPITPCAGGVCWVNFSQGTVLRYVDVACSE